MYYHKCLYCGDNLDPGEKCDCRERQQERHIKLQELFAVGLNGQLLIRECENDTRI